MIRAVSTEVTQRLDVGEREGASVGAAGAGSFSPLYIPLEERDACGGVAVFDFDGTLYRGDSSVDFIRWCIGRFPDCRRHWLAHAPKALVAYLMGRAPKVHFKEEGFGFLSLVDEPAELVATWWQERRGGFEVPAAGAALEGAAAAQGAFKPAVIAALKPGDVIASASPRFMVEPITQVMGLRLIASEADICTGRFDSPNCYGQAKADRLCVDLLDVNGGAAGGAARPIVAVEDAAPGSETGSAPALHISSFYSDSLSDTPCAEMADQAWFVDGEKLLRWEDYREPLLKRLKYAPMHRA